jgi:hypothetical protein
MLSPSRWFIPSSGSVLGMALIALPFPHIQGWLIHVVAVVVVACFCVTDVVENKLKSNSDSTHF